MHVALLHNLGLCGAYWTRSSSVWVGAQEDRWEPEGSGVQGKAAEAHSGKRASQGGSMSSMLAFILQAEKWSRYPQREATHLSPEYQRKYIGNFWLSGRKSFEWLAWKIHAE